MSYEGRIRIPIIRVSRDGSLSGGLRGYSLRQRNRRSGDADFLKDGASFTDASTIHQVDSQGLLHTADGSRELARGKFPPKCSASDGHAMIRDATKLSRDEVPSTAP